MRERLIELIKDSNVLSTCGCHYNDIGYCSKQLSDYLLQNGVVMLPCKVGDTVYCLCGDKIYEKTIACFVQYKCTTMAFFTVHLTEWCGLCDFGRTVFLTREEAEKALE